MPLFKKNKQKTIPEPTTPQPIDQTQDRAEQLDGELIAVITAAIQAMLGEQEGQLVVRSFRRVGAAQSLWMAQNRAERLGL